MKMKENEMNIGILEIQNMFCMKYLMYSIIYPILGNEVLTLA